jgi:hypothetical protein
MIDRLIAGINLPTMLAGRPAGTRGDHRRPVRPMLVMAALFGVLAGGVPSAGANRQSRRARTPRSASGWQR